MNDKSNTATDAQAASDFRAGYAIGVERGHSTAQVRAEVTEEMVREDREVCERAIENHLEGRALATAFDREITGQTSAWRKQPPTVDEVKEHRWWWNRGNAIAWIVVEFDVVDGRIVHADLGGGVLRPEHYGAEWAPCLPPESP